MYPLTISYAQLQFNQNFQTKLIIDLGARKNSYKQPEYQYGAKWYELFSVLLSKEAGWSIIAQLHSTVKSIR